jgi:D-alanyl-D-alanine carboxypeptidase (penicillin-binding protein 5/6)
MRIKAKYLKRMKRLLVIGLSAIVWSVCLFSSAAAIPANEQTSSKQPQEEQEHLNLYATAAVLMDGDSGRVLYGVNEETVLPMASTTKIMTCILILENGNLADMAEASSYAASMPQVRLGVRAKESYGVKDLLYALMLESFNDAAVVLAEYIGKEYLPEDIQQLGVGSFSQEQSKEAVAAFAALMNQKAQDIGCKNTWFITPNGLDAEETYVTKEGETVTKAHSTTAEDLARIMAYCIKQSPQKEAFLEITRTSAYSFSGGNGRSFSCVNHNAFLNMMAGALTGKTGFTNKAGYCYVGALQRDNKTLIVALLACGWPNHKTYKWSDTRTLMLYGLENYTYHTFDEAAYPEENLPNLLVENGRPNHLGENAYTGLSITDRPKEHNGTQASSLASQGILLRDGEQIQVICKLKETLPAPIEEGTGAGMIYYLVDGKVYRSEEIVTTESIEAIDYKWCFQQIISRYLQQI